MRGTMRGKRGHNGCILRIHMETSAGGTRL